MTTPPSREELLARFDRLKAAAPSSLPPRPGASQRARDAAEAEARWQAGISDPDAASWRDQYRAELENEGRAWHSDVVRETPECGHPEHQGNTWLRHVPTGVLVHHRGRSEAGTLAHLADLLGQHKLIREDERAVMHEPGCDCGPNAHPDPAE